MGMREVGSTIRGGRATWKRDDGACDWSEDLQDTPSIVYGLWHGVSGWLDTLVALSLPRPHGGGSCHDWVYRHDFGNTKEQRVGGCDDGWTDLLLILYGWRDLRWLSCIWKRTEHGMTLRYHNDCCIVL